jgi:hypothetical protein
LRENYKNSCVNLSREGRFEKSDYEAPKMAMTSYQGKRKNIAL